MPTFRLRDVLQATRGTVLGPTPELEFEGVSTDTRTITPRSLFVALAGPRHDAHEFLAEAAGRGARAALVERPSTGSDRPPLVQIKVEDTRAALGDLAREHARRQPARRVAVTGSNGKTTTKDLLAAVLREGGPTVASPRSYNNFIGVPLTLLEIEPDSRFAAIELGTNAPGEIRALARLVAPDVGIVTNCCSAHVERLGDLDGVIEEKGALVEELPAAGLAVLNADDPSFEPIRRRASCEVVSFGVRGPADFLATDLRFDLSRVSFRLDGQPVEVPLGGCHNVYNSLAALAAASVLGIPRDRALAGLREAEGPPMRLRPRRIAELLVVDDTYNANPGSVEAAFRTLAAAEDDTRKVVILGDMMELGEQAAELHRRAGSLVSLLELGLLVAVGDHAESVRQGALDKGFPPERLRTYPDAASAAREVGALLEPGDTVLIKGSRAMAMERIVESLELVGAASAG
jgi:UDP-N-acetylmuramoyl-tripeptide--D-alanyl-D-alanine ligase